jgi:hypothetical protein
VIENPQPEAQVIALVVDVVFPNRDSEPLTNLMPVVEGQHQVDG